VAPSDPDPASREAARALVGRAAEVERVVRLTGEAAQQGAALMIFGDPGVGKSALLNVAAGVFAARGGQVLAAAGLEHEAEIAFSALSLLLHPLRAHLTELDVPHRQGLSVVLGLADGPAPSRLVVANSVLALLRLMADRSPLLMIVDDLQWVDRPSAAILGLVSRRLAETRVGFLGAARTGEAGFFESSGLPELRVEALSSEAASSLVDAEFPRLAAQVRQRVLTESEGNPLALLELPAALSLPERAAEQVLPDVLPLGRKLQETFAARLVQLPDSARDLLLLAALDGTGELAVLHRVSAAGSGLDVLAPAEQAHLVRVDDSAGRVIFRHPLVRAAVVAASTSAGRRHAHRALAHQLTSQPERRAWHLAASCVQPDEAVSALLEATAASVLRRGDAVGAVAALIRAADLHPGGDQRSRLLAQAAFVGAGVAGDLASVPRLLADARQADPGHGESLQAAVAASYALLNGDGDLLTAHRLLVSAIETRTAALRTGRAGLGAGDHSAEVHSAVDPALADALHSLLSVCSWTGRADLWPPLLSAIEDLGPQLPRMLQLRVRVQGDPARLDPATLAEFDNAIRGLGEQSDPARIVQIAIAAIYTDRIDDCREPLWRVVRDGRSGGAITLAIRAMMALCVEDFAVGHWDEVDDLATEGLRLCADHGYGLATWFLRFGQAMVAAGRGDEDLVRSLTERMMGWAAPRGVGAVQMFARHARGLSALGRGAFEEAYQQLAAISSPGTLPAYTAYALKIPLDLVEAAVRTGRRDEAAAQVQAMRAAGLPSLSGHLALMTAAAAALCAPDADAAGLFEAALNVPGADRWPFDLARVHLAYGEQLRRRPAPAAARRHLGTALDMFSSLGAQPWVARAANELRASGRTRRRGDDASAGALTPQEREIALMAAAGLSNRQIGERLFLSHRTVGTHLYRAFPKLGITSRAALRDALTRTPEDGAPSAR
jgi:DNA-binding CsgD family transcriptional regulator/energy-coupling factor transporter ATP-binding protein EcfA2